MVKIAVSQSLQVFTIFSAKKRSNRNKKYIFVISFSSSIKPCTYKRKQKFTPILHFRYLSFFWSASLSLMTNRNIFGSGWRFTKSQPNRYSNYVLANITFKKSWAITNTLHPIRRIILHFDTLEKNGTIPNQKGYRERKKGFVRSTEPKRVQNWLQLSETFQVRYRPL